MSETQSIDYGMDTDKAAHLNKYNNKIQKLKDIASGKVKIQNKVSDEMREFYSPQPDDEFDNEEKVNSKPKESGFYVSIESKKKNFEITYPIDYAQDSDKVVYPPMSLELEAYNIDITDDAISVIMEPTIAIRFPKLKAITFKCDGIKYKVAWAGAMTTFGSLKYISFIKID